MLITFKNALPRKLNVTTFKLFSRLNYRYVTNVFSIELVKRFNRNAILIEIVTAVLLVVLVLVTLDIVFYVFVLQINNISTIYF